MNRLLQLVTASFLASTGVYALAQTGHAREAAPGSARWMFQYQNITTVSGGSKEIRTDPRFRMLLARNLRQPQFLIGGPQSLAKVAELFLTVYVDDVHAEENRYASVNGCFPHDCDEKEGFLWVDTKDDRPFVLFAALVAIDSNQRPQSNFHVWIFSNRPIPNDFGKDLPLPANFLTQFRDWFATTGGRHLASAVFVEPDNKTVPMLPSTLVAEGDHQ